MERRKFTRDFKLEAVTMAEMLGLSQATVKTHLQNVFRKTGTNRQSALIKLVAGV
jgi:DNA-binding CsgD family transcriptional regulator